MYVSTTPLVNAPRRGSVSVFVAVCLTLLLAIVAISLDGGMLLSERRHAQTVADAAALAAAADLYLGNSVATAQQSALNSAAVNGYANDGATSVITPNLTDGNGKPVHGIWIPPITGDHAGDPNYVEVVVQWNQGRTFSSIFAPDAIPVRARAVAQGSTNPHSGSAFLTLDPSAQSALKISQYATVTGNSGVVVNSNHSQALTADDDSSMTAPTINITGNRSSTGTLNGQVNTGVAATPDPLANLAVPNPNSLSSQSNSALNLSDGAPHTLYPGVYYGGISVSGGTSVTLSPGLYYLQGGGLTHSGSGNLTGNGVTIYNSPTGSGDQISLTSVGNVTLSPPTTGPYAGMSVFQDRNSSVPASLCGGSGCNITGTFYLAGARVCVTGSTAQAQLGSQHICRCATLSGKVNVTWDSKKVARKRAVQLVE